MDAFDVSKADDWIVDISLPIGDLRRAALEDGRLDHVAFYLTCWFWRLFTTNQGRDYRLKRFVTRARNTAAPSPDDLAEAECIDAALQAAIDKLRDAIAGNRARTISSLTKPEMRSVVWAAISAWIAKRSELESRLGDTLDQVLNDSIDDLFR